MNRKNNLEIEICSDCNAVGPFDPWYIRQWIESALDDVIEAENSHSNRHALFWVQQASEKLCKSYLLMTGTLCYCKATTRVGHDSLIHFLRLIEDTIRKINLPKEFSRSFIGELRRMRRISSQKKAVFMTMPPDQVEAIINTASSHDDNMKKAIALVSKSGRQIGNVPKEQILHARIIVNVYILTVITWLHERSVRYPTHPESANLSLLDAANQTQRFRGMGFNHYTDEIGAVYHVKTLARIARETTEELLMAMNSSK